MKKTMGEIISSLRKEKGMTQKDLAELMGVTDKAVSKWERNLSCPDISSIPQLAEALDTSVETLMDVKPRGEEQNQTAAEIWDNILKGLPVAMGVGLAVISVMEWRADYSGYFFMAGVGIFCLALRQMKD